MCVCMAVCVCVCVSVLFGCIGLDRNVILAYGIYVSQLAVWELEDDKLKAAMKLIKSQCKAPKVDKKSTEPQRADGMQHVPLETIAVC